MSEVAVTIKEWEREDPTPGGRLAGIELKDQAERTLAEKLTQDGRLEIQELRQGLSIQATSYVGSLRLGQVRITILPKLAGKPLLTLLRYAYGLRNLNLFSPVAHSYEPRAFQDLLIWQLADEATELLDRGLHRRYEPLQEDLPSPKGRIDFQSLIRQGGVNKPRLPCLHHPRLENTLVNKFLLAGILLGAKNTDDLDLKARLRQLAGQMQDNIVPLHPLDWGAVRRVRSAEDRMTQAYQHARVVIELLLEGLGITINGLSSLTPAPGFLFDMNRFFQELLSKFLRENLEGLTVLDEHRLTGMMLYDPMYNPLRRSPPTLRPDFVILNRLQLVAILDAKYRDLWEKPLPREMLYQLSIYALGRFAGVKSAIILYPTVEAGAKEARIHIMDPIKEHSHAHVILRPINLLTLEGLLAGPQRVNKDRLRQAFAREIVFGKA